MDTDVSGMQTPTDIPASSEGDRRPRSAWISVPVWAGVAVVLIAAALYGIDGTEHRLLVREAERTALHYADFISRTVPDLDRVFDEGELTEEAHSALLRSRQLGEVFRFKLFDRDGRELLVSDNLDASTPLSDHGAARLGTHHGNSHVGRVVPGGENHIELEDGRGIPDRPDVYSEAYVPLQGPDGLVGVLEVYVDQSELQLSAALASGEVALIVLALILLGGAGIGWQLRQRLSDRRRGELKIRYLAEHDTLSGAFNRASFETALAATERAATAAGSRFAIHCIDLDRFKEVNDTLGHAAGDQVLREVAARLDALCRPGDVLARLGGDEFAILQLTLDGPQDVETRGQAIVDALSRPLEIDAHRVPCDVSVGAACFGVDATDVDELLHKADLAMYRSKRSGRGRFSFYDETLDRELEDRRLLALDLRTALADNTLSLHYQPLFEASNPSSPTGFEALMRWEHAERGNVPPMIFIPLAEETGIIESLGSWAIEQACRDAATWTSGARVAVNLSPAQFKDGAVDVVTVVEQSLERTGLPPERLELEITESLLISDPEQVLKSLDRLSALGVKIAMDDFGTGYSSLSYLWRFPFDKVKIDRAFVQGLEHEDRVLPIISSIVSLAHSLGMRVNAEGVETESQHEALRRLGCDELQGFLLGRPAPMFRDEAETGQRAA